MSVDVLICIFIGLFCISGFSYYVLKIYGIINNNKDEVLELEEDYLLEL